MSDARRRETCQEGEGVEGEGAGINEGGEGASKGRCQVPTREWLNLCFLIKRDPLSNRGRICIV